MKTAIVLLSLAVLIVGCDKQSATTKSAGLDQMTETIFKNLMAATMANNYDAFIAECDDTMKATLTKLTLEVVSDQIEPRAKQGYDAQ